MLCHIYMITILKHPKTTEMAVSDHVISNALNSGQLSFMSCGDGRQDSLLANCHWPRPLVTWLMTFPRWHLKMAKTDGWSSSKLPFKHKQRLWAFVLLLALGKKPPHFKFDINRLKPAGVMVQKPPCVNYANEANSCHGCHTVQKIAGGMRFAFTEWP